MSLRSLENVGQKYSPIFKALISAVGVTIVLGIPSISIYPLIFVLLFVYVYKRVEIKNVYIDIASFIFALFLTMGKIDFIRESRWGGMDSYSFFRKLLDNRLDCWPYIFVLR